MPNVINVEDPLIKAKLRLEKKDAETGKKIPLAGVSGIIGELLAWSITEKRFRRFSCFIVNKEVCL